MKLRFKWRSLFLLAIATFLFTAPGARAQDKTPRKRLTSPATVRSTIGGEAIAHYIIRARQGRTMTVQISWRKEDDNTASFSVTSAKSDSEQLPGEESDNGKRWTGKIPKTGYYLIDVTAHPIADYKLKVTVK